MTIYEANDKLIQIGNAIITQECGKYYVVSRISLTPETLKSLQYQDGFDTIQEAFNYAVQLKRNWKMVFSE